MRDVAWNFATSAPADLEGFKLAVAHYQQEVSNTLWEGERVVCPSGLLTIVVHRPWLDGEKGLTWLELESPDKTAWTEAQLMFSLHQAMTKLGELYDHSYFEGLIRHDERSFELILGS
ncbi:MAG: hypothetical protein KDA93_20875 [Planctomycetaceae bacterium]|nr:hypothetical protein [Planctomycetaceae bacterium]